jgi:hypothetical protein
MLSAGRCSTVRWSRSGQETGSISLTAQECGLHLRYSTTDDRGAPLIVSELIPFTYMGAGFGGRRQWLTCLSCGRGCRVSYGGRYFRCRLCHGLRYQSQSEPDYDRAIEQATRIGVRLGDKMFKAFEADELPPKPPTHAVEYLSQTGAAIRGPAMSVEGWGVGPLRHLVLTG